MLLCSFEGRGRDEGRTGGGVGRGCTHAMRGLDWGGGVGGGGGGQEVCSGVLFLCVTVLGTKQMSVVV